MEQLFNQEPPTETNVLRKRACEKLNITMEELNVLEYAGDPAEILHAPVHIRLPITVPFTDIGSFLDGFLAMVTSNPTLFDHQTDLMLSAIREAGADALAVVIAKRMAEANNQ